MYKVINTIVAVLVAIGIAALCYSYSSLNEAKDEITETSARLDATTDSLTAARQLNDSLTADGNNLRKQVAEADAAREKAENGLKNKVKEFRLIAINPTVEKDKTESTGKLTINKVTIGPEGTSVKLTFNNPKQKGSSHHRWDWCSIEKETYIVAQGKKYKMKRAEGIEVYPSTTTVEHKDSHTFTLYFPVIPSSTTKIDLVEPKTEWQFYGISLR